MLLKIFYLFISPKLYFREHKLMEIVFKTQQHFVGNTSLALELNYQLIRS